MIDDILNTYVIHTKYKAKLKSSDKFKINDLVSLAFGIKLTSQLIEHYKKAPSHGIYINTLLSQDNILSIEFLSLPIETSGKFGYKLNAGGVCQISSPVVCNISEYEGEYGTKIKYPVNFKKDQNDENKFHANIPLDLFRYKNNNGDGCKVKKVNVEFSTSNSLATRSHTVFTNTILDDTPVITTVVNVKTDIPVTPTERCIKDKFILHLSRVVEKRKNQNARTVLKIYIPKNQRSKLNEYLENSHDTIYLKPMLSLTNDKNNNSLKIGIVSCQKNSNTANQAGCYMLDFRNSCKVTSLRMINAKTALRKTEIINLECDIVVVNGVTTLQTLIPNTFLECNTETFPSVNPHGIKYMPDNELSSNEESSNGSNHKTTNDTPMTVENLKEIPLTQLYPFHVNYFKKHTVISNVELSTLCNMLYTLLGTTYLDIDFLSEDVVVIRTYNNTDRYTRFLVNKGSDLWNATRFLIDDEKKKRAESLYNIQKNIELEKLASTIN